MRLTWRVNGADAHPPRRPPGRDSEQRRQKQRDGEREDRDPGAGKRRTPGPAERQPGGRSEHQSGKVDEEVAGRRAGREHVRHSHSDGACAAEKAEQAWSSGNEFMVEDLRVEGAGGKRRERAAAQAERSRAAIAIPAAARRHPAAKRRAARSSGISAASRIMARDQVDRCGGSRREAAHSIRDARRRAAPLTTTPRPERQPASGTGEPIAAASARASRWPAGVRR
jgi:hypothetical protein